MQIEETVKVAGQEKAHKRHLETELVALQRQLKNSYNSLEGDMDSFATILRDAQAARSTLEVGETTWS